MDLLNAIAEIFECSPEYLREFFLEIPRKNPGEIQKKTPGRNSDNVREILIMFVNFSRNVLRNT